MAALAAVCTGCTAAVATTGALDLPVALDARARVTPSVSRDTLIAAGDAGVLRELTGTVTDVLVRGQPDQWQIVVQEREQPQDLAEPLPDTPPPVLARWSITVDVATGMVIPFDEGDIVRVRRHVWLDDGRATPPAPPDPARVSSTGPEASLRGEGALGVAGDGVVRESLVIERLGQLPSLVFVDGPAPAAMIEHVPGAVRPTPTGVIVYTTSGRDERACHRLVEHRAFTFPADPKRRVRPGETAVVAVGTDTWTLAAIDLAVTVESTTCPDRVWNRAAWLAVRDREVAPLTD